VTIEAVHIRSAVLADAPLLLTYLGKKAEFDRSTAALTGTLATTRARIEATLFGEPRFAHALIAEHAGAARGFALFYFRYSSFAGRPSLWLDDLYVDIDARSLGIGAHLLARLRELAAAHGCTHLGWTASVKNPRGIAFYERAGATIVDRNDREVTLRLGIDPG
jgi:GNAT superfamily N-acetyltransferase